MNNLSSEDNKEPTHEELENVIINFANSLGKNDLVGEIFLEEFFKIINKKNSRSSK